MKWFRPLIVVALVISAVTAFFMRLVDAEAFWVFATGLIIYWFKARDDSKERGNGI